MAAVPEEGAPSDDPEPMSDADVAACSPSRPDVPADVMDAAAALVSASSGGVHVRPSTDIHMQPYVMADTGRMPK